MCNQAQLVDKALTNRRGASADEFLAERTVGPPLAINDACPLRGPRALDAFDRSSPIYLYSIEQPHLVPLAVSHSPRARKKYEIPVVGHRTPGLPGTLSIFRAVLRRKNLCRGWSIACRIQQNENLLEFDRRRVDKSPSLSSPPLVCSCQGKSIFSFYFLVSYDAQQSFRFFERLASFTGRRIVNFPNFQTFTDRPAGIYTFLASLNFTAAVYAKLRPPSAFPLNFLFVKRALRPRSPSLCRIIKRILLLLSLLPARLVSFFSLGKKPPR